MSAPAERDPLVGTTVAGRYEVIRKIGRGGMGAIYEVRHTRLSRSFALKTLTWEVAENPEVVARFQREADVIAKLRHPNIVEIVDWDALADGTPCLIMEFLRGEDLAQRLRRGPLAWNVLATFGDQVLGALAVAHRADVVHRDLKPQNIFLSVDDAGEERAKLLDFGVSKIRGSKSFATTDARLIGTPAYMSPEQADGAHDEIGPATDVWAMGAILFEMATGKVAFDGASVPQILYRICHRGPDDLLKHRPDAPPAFVKLIDRALSREPDNRIRDVDTMRAELRVALTGVGDVRFADSLVAPSMTIRPETRPPTGHEETVAATPVSTPGRAPISLGEQPTTLSSSIGQSITTPPKPAPRKRGGLIALGLLVAGAGVAVAFVMSGGKSSNDQPKGSSEPAAARDVDPPPPATGPAIDATPAPVSPTTVTLKIDSTPSGATVVRMPSGEEVGKTPYAETVPRVEGQLEFQVKLDGHVAQIVSLPTTDNGVAKVTLPAVKKTDGGRKRPPSGDGKKPPPSGDGRKKGAPVDPFGE